MWTIMEWRKRVRRVILSCLVLILLSQWSRIVSKDYLCSGSKCTRTSYTWVWGNTDHQRGTGVLPQWASSKPTVPGQVCGYIWHDNANDRGGVAQSLDRLTQVSDVEGLLESRHRTRWQSTLIKLVVNYMFSSHKMWFDITGQYAASRCLGWFYRRD